MNNFKINQFCNFLLEVIKEVEPHDSYGNYKIDIKIIDTNFNYDFIKDLAEFYFDVITITNNNGDNIYRTTLIQTVTANQITFNKNTIESYIK